MKILITGTTGYIAKRLALRLLEAGHELVCCVRDLQRIPDEIEYKKNIKFIKVDFLDVKDVALDLDIDVAYYLIHSMATSSKDFEVLEKTCSQNFKLLVEQTRCKQVVYLSGIVNDSSLSKHLASRFQVEKKIAF
jgi:nucleoside-diphosphate-sugar epimerase